MARVNVVAYLDSSPGRHGTEYRGLVVRPPTWAAGHADLVLCSSFAHELTQLELLDTIAVKAVLSHPPSRAAGGGAHAAPVPAAVGCGCACAEPCRG
jgi:hypothetical protein